MKGGDQMNCLKCGAQLEEGSTTTLCANCQALETLPPEEKLPENTPLETQEPVVDETSEQPLQNIEPTPETTIEKPQDPTDKEPPTSGV